MGYRIDYHKESEKYVERHPFRRLYFTVLSFGVFLLFVYFFWSDGRESILRIVFPADRTAAQKAAECFVENIQRGVSIKASLITFLRDLTEGVKLA